MTQPVLNIQMVPAAVELVIATLRKLPHEQVDDLVQELWGQYKTQMQQLAEVTLTAPVDHDVKVVEEVSGLTD